MMHFLFRLVCLQQKMIIEQELLLCTTKMVDQGKGIFSHQLQQHLVELGELLG